MEYEDMTPEQLTAIAHAKMQNHMRGTLRGLLMRIPDAHKEDVYAAMLVTMHLEPAIFAAFTAHVFSGEEMRSWFEGIWNTMKAANN